MSDLFSQITAFLVGLIDLLNLILLPTTPEGIVDWALLPQQPLKLVTWSALLFLFVPMLGRFVVGLTRPAKPRRRTPQRPPAVPPPKAPPKAAPAAAAKPRTTKLKDASAPTVCKRGCTHTVTLDGQTLQAKTLRKRKYATLFATAQGFAIVDAASGDVRSTHQEEAAALAALDALKPPRQRKPSAPKAPPAAKPAQASAADLRLTKAFGSDPSHVYDFRYRVVELDDLIASNTDKGGINPDYDQTLQPRQRQRAASQRQIEQLAKNLVPEAYLWDFKQLDKGAPIIGSDQMVESGNGRTLALRKARDLVPERWNAYQAALRQQAAELGIDAAELEGKAAPVLVRERLTDVDRAAFAREANAPPVLQLSPLEQARIDAGRISDDSLLQLTVKEEQSIDKALRAAANRGFVQGFLGTLSDNEQAVLLRKDGTLNQMGIWRMKAALFTRAFPGEAGERIAETFLEALDSDVKNFESSISTTLPRLSRAESLMRAGQRDDTWSISDDVAKALDMLERLRETEMLPQHYVEQSSLFERELTPTQERLLLHFDAIGKKPKSIRRFFNRYADLVEQAPQKGQVDMFGESLAPTKDQVLDRIINEEVTA